MSNPLDYIQKNPERTQRLLGLTYQQWQQLTKSAIAEYQKQQDILEKSKIRINAPGGGRKPILTLEEEICLCLFYLRQMPTFEVPANQGNRSYFVSNVLDKTASMS